MGLLGKESEHISTLQCTRVAAASLASSGARRRVLSQSVSTLFLFECSSIHHIVHSFVLVLFSHEFVYQCLLRSIDGILSLEPRTDINPGICCCFVSIQRNYPLTSILSPCGEEIINRTVPVPVGNFAWRIYLLMMFYVTYQSIRGKTFRRGEQNEHVKLTEYSTILELQTSTFSFSISMFFKLLNCVFF